MRVASKVRGLIAAWLSAAALTPLTLFAQVDPAHTLKIAPELRARDEAQTATSAAESPASPASPLDLRIDSVAPTPPATPLAAPAAGATPPIEATPPASAAPPLDAKPSVDAPKPAAPPPPPPPAEPAPTTPSAPTLAPQSPLTVPLDTGLIARPRLRVGDAWLYRRRITGEPTTLLEQEVTTLTATTISLRSNVRGSNDSTVVLYTREWNLIATSTNSFDPALIHYSYSLYRGKKWRNLIAVKGAEEGQNGSLLVTGEALAWEEIEVPAGRFRALRIEISLEAPNPAERDKSLRIRETHWVNAEAQRPVKLEIETRVPGQPTRTETVELAAYRIGE